MPVRQRLDHVFDVGDADDVVHVIVVDGDPREAALVHDGEDVAERRRVLHGDHVDARHHDLAGDRAGEVEHVMYHRLLVVAQLIGVMDDVLQLVLGHVLPVVGILDVQQPGAMPFADADVTQTSGLTSFENAVRNPATRFETPSASDMAILFGSSSPTTIEKYDRMSVIATGAMPEAAPCGMPTDMSASASGSDRLVAANAELAKPTSVIATCIAARNELGSSMSADALLARLSPSSAS